MNKSFFTIAALAVTGASWGQQFAQIPNSFRHPEANSYLPTPAADGEAVHFAIALQPRDPVGFQKFVDAVSDPTSPTYRHFITPEQVAAQFGPAPSDIDAVKSYLVANGITVTEVAKNGLAIIADGTAKQVSLAFKTSLGHVSHTDSTGEMRNYRTNLSPLYVPNTFASKIVSVEGVDTSLRHKMRFTTTLNPTLLRGAYQTSLAYAKGFQGKGVNVAIANWDGYRLNNIPYLVAAYGLPIPSGGVGSNITIVEVGTGSTDGSGTPAGEGDLDIQSVIGVAPLSHVYVYDDAQSDTAAPLTTYSKIASDNIADVCSESYGWETDYSGAGATYTACHNEHLSMSAQGITYCVASGDSGTDLYTSTPRYAYPNFDPEVWMVGGSVVTVDSTTGQRQSETPWGLSGGWGGTGGFDPYDTPATGFAFNVPPSYQLKYLPTQVGTYPYRLCPDTVSSAGGQNGLGNDDGSGWAYIIYFNTGAGTSAPPGTTTVIDGTSFASPATAGGFADVLCQLFNGQTPNPTRSNVREGRVQDKLYMNGANFSVFNDITTGSSVGNLPGTSVAAVPGPGWDFATGWGSINFNGLYNALAGTLYSQTIGGTANTTSTYDNGKYLSGTLNATNGTYYDVQSSLVSGLGQVAGTEIDFTPKLPTGYAPTSATLTVTSDGKAQTTVQLYIYNNKTKVWDLYGSQPSFGNPITYSKIPLSTSNYVSSTGVVKIISRCLLPSRLGTNTFIYGISTATVVEGAAPVTSG